jgi:hypothetical protein
MMTISTACQESVFTEALLTTATTGLTSTQNVAKKNPIHLKVKRTGLKLLKVSGKNLMMRQ